MSNEQLAPTTYPTTEVPPSALRPGMILDDAGEHRIVVYVAPDTWASQAYHVRSVGQVGPEERTHTIARPVRVVERSPEPWKEPLRATPSTAILSRNGLSITLGADPEVFVLDSNGEVLPAFAYLPCKAGAVEFPQGTAFYDGFQAEWTVTPYPHNWECLSYHADWLRLGMQQVWNAARVVDPGARLTMASVVPIPHRMIHEIPEEHFQLGCSPSENVYGEERLRVGDPRQLPFRSAGWHMHMGFKDPLPTEKVHDAVRMMDRVLGVALVTLGQAYQYPERRTLYGRAGEYRYGRTLEYRVPEVLMGAHPATWNLCWDLGRMAAWLGLGGLGFLWDAEDDEVRHAINRSDVAVATKILQRNEDMLRKMISVLYWGAKPDSEFTRETLATLYEGIGHAVERPEDIAGNWKLDGEWMGHNGMPRTTWNSACYSKLKDGGKA